MKEGDERDPPFFFQKPADALVFDGGTVPYPPATTDFQYEVELVVAIGTAGAFIAVDDALNHVYGYAIGIDMTRARSATRSARASASVGAGKVFRSLSAVRPALPKKRCRRHRIGCNQPFGEWHPASASRSEANDLERPEIIANLSKQYRLEPGDLIFTGTPAGVGPVEVNDRIEATIGGLGSLSITITSKEV